MNETEDWNTDNETENETEKGKKRGISMERSYAGMKNKKSRRLPLTNQIQK